MQHCFRVNRRHKQEQPCLPGVYTLKASCSYIFWKYLKEKFTKQLRHGLGKEKGLVGWAGNPHVSVGSFMHRANDKL